MKHLLLLIICGWMHCSCTITKRHFGSGYYVEWNRKIRMVPNKDAEESSGMKSTDMCVTQKNTLEAGSLMTDSSETFELVVTAAVPEVEVKQVLEDQKEESPLKYEGEIQTNQEIKTIGSRVTKDEVENVSKRRMHPLMWGIWGMWSIAIACMFFVTFYAEALIGVGLGFFIAMIFAIIVIRALRKHPEKYGFKGLIYGFARPAIVFGGIALAGLLLFLGGGYGISY